MKFFKPEDFYFDPDGGILVRDAADKANAKLESESRIVIGSPETDWNELGNKIETHKALLINIEEIEKCKHPREKVRFVECGTSGDPNIYKEYECKCGAKVQPKEFEEVK